MVRVWGRGRYQVWWFGGRPGNHRLELAKTAALKSCKVITYLGVTLDERGSFGPYLSRLTSNIEKKVSRLNMKDPSTVVNMVLHAAPIWWKLTNIKKDLHMMERIERNMLR